MDVAFPRVESILNRLRNVVKCQTCLTLREEDSMLFFHGCDHFYCSDCMGKSEKCPLCENVFDKPIKIKNDKNILSLYKTLVKFQLPSKNDVQKIYQKHLESKKRILKTIQRRRDASSKNEKPVDKILIDLTRSKGTKSTKDPFGKRNEINSNQSLLRVEKNSGGVITILNVEVPAVDVTPKGIKKDSRLKKYEIVTPSQMSTRGKRIDLEKMLMIRGKHLTVNSTPNATVKSIPNATVKSISNATVKSIPNATVKSIPNATVKSIPNATVKSIPNATVKSIPIATVKSIPNATKQNVNTNITPAGSSKGNSSYPKFNINKRNAKGETSLHLACKKSNFTLMKQLIAAGANPNAQDNAGWTPLHDSIFSGKIDVIKFLLDNGANVNMRGLENTTALHEAIATGNIEIVKLLLDYGADIKAMNIFRQTPLDLVIKHNLTDFIDLLLEARKKAKYMDVKSSERKDVIENLALYKHQLTIEDEKLVNKFAVRFNATLTPSLTSKTYCGTVLNYVSHIIVPVNRVYLTWSFITAVFTGCWVVTIDWVKDSLREDSLQPADSYETTKVLVSGFTRFRINKLNGLPGLFSGCHFFFGGNFEFYSVKHLMFGKQDVKSLIVQNGGVVLKRCPDPESLTLEKTVPFHACPSSSIHDTSYFIIYQTECWDPELKYNMSHMKTLPIEWLLTCIFKFELVDPNNKDNSYCDFL